jgi:serine protein kinase
MTFAQDLLTRYSENFQNRREIEMSVPEYLELCRNDSMAFASAPERILAAIGEPVIVDTSKDARLGRIFSNRSIRTYPAFAEFFGMEDTVERIVAFFRHARPFFNESE